MIQLSLLQLRDCWVDEFNSRAVFPEENAQPGAASIDMNLAANFQLANRDDDPRSFKMIMDVRFQPEQEIEGVKTYHIHFRITGIFEIHPEAPESTFENYKHMSAPSVLYGVARGLVMMMTSMSRSGRMMMPSLDPRTFGNAQSDNKMQEEQEKKSLPPRRKRKTKA